jgi:hypothetical protein
MKEENFYRKDGLRSDPRTFGDAAAEGLIGGIAAGIVMIIFLGIAAVLQGDTITSLIGRFRPSEDLPPITGIFSHLAVSAVYGAIFGVFVRMINNWRHLPSLFLGIVYGVLLALGAQLFLLPTFDSPLQEIPALIFFTAHLIYGFVLGMIVK